MERALENSKLYEEALLRTHELESLFTIASITSQPGSFTTKASRMLDEMTRVVGADWATLRRFDRVEDGLRLLASAGPGLTKYSPASMAPVGVFGATVLNGETLVINDYANYPSNSRAFLSEDAGSLVGLPVKVEGQTVAVVIMVSTSTEHFTAERIRLLTTIAGELGGLLQNAQLYEEVTSELEQRRQVEETLVESEERYRRLVELSPESIFVHRNGKIEYVNDAGAKLVGANSPEECIGKYVLDFVPPEYREIMKERIKQVQAGEKLGIAESKVLQLSGEVRDVEVVGSVISYGGKAAVHAFHRDITERKLSEAALRESLERFDRAVRGSSDGIWDRTIDPTKPEELSTEEYFSPRFKEMLGYSDDEFANIHENWESRIHPEDHDRVVEAVRLHFEYRRPYDQVYRLKTKSEDYRWFRARGQAVWDDIGRPTRMAGALTDVTENRSRGCSSRE